MCAFNISGNAREVATRQQVLELIKYEPGKHRQVDLAKMFGVSRQRVSKIVSELGLKDKLRRRGRCVCVQCGKPTAEPNGLCRECWKRSLLKKQVVFFCDNCGRVNQRTLSHFKGCNLHFCNRHCRSVYLGKHYGFRSASAGKGQATSE